MLGGYRPISLIGCLYKIIAKSLAFKLNQVIRTVISIEESTYIAGRNILEGPIIINEIYYWARKAKKKSFIFKVDSEKAFDSINWNYLDPVMGQIGFVSR